MAFGFVSVSLMVLGLAISDRKAVKEFSVFSFQFSD